MPSSRCNHSSCFSSSALTFVLQNIRSLRKNFDEFVAHIQTLDEPPDILFLTETWIYSNEMEHFNIENYTSFHKCNDSYAAGGVCAFVISDLVNNTTATSLDFKSFDCLKLDIVVSGHKLTFLCCYRFHFVSIPEFLVDYNNLLASCNNVNLFLIGDINIDVLNVNDNVNDYKNLSCRFGLEMLYETPTRSSGSCIDHVHFKCRNFSVTPEYAVLDLGITDHFFIHVGIDVLNFVKSVKHTNQQLDVIRFESLCSDLIGEDWLSVDDETDCDRAFLNLIDSLNLYIKKHSYTVRKSNDNIKLKPWITKGIINKINFKKTLIKKLNKDPNNQQLKRKVLNYSKKLKIQICNTKNLFYKSKLINNPFCPKTIWGITNDILGKNRRPVNNSFPITDLNGDTIDVDTDKANSFNKYFTSVFTCPGTDYKKYFNIQNSFVISDISGMDILKAVKSLKQTGSNDVYGMNSKLIKRIIFPILDVLIYLFNLSLQTGTYPNCLKQSIVLPIYKKGNRSDMSNYRPISLSPVIGKLLEKIMGARIVSYISKYDLVSPSQHGFFKGRSTETAISSLLSYVEDSFDRGLGVGSVFVDLTKAFDTVNIDILLWRLNECGFRGTMYEWLRSYLLNRIQRVNINGTLSDPLHVNCGVPQGSVLGPLLFLIYIEPVFRIGLKSNLIVYADDMTIMNNSIQFKELLNSDLLLLNSWCSSNSLSISDKTRSMSFGLSARKRTPLNIQLPNGISQNCDYSLTSITQVESYKYLGVILDSDLSWHSHCNYVTNKCRPALRQIYLLRNILSERNLLSIYNGLVNCHLNYCLSAWGGTHDSKINKVAVLQNMVLRAIYKETRFTSAGPLFLKSNVLPIRNLYVYKVLRLYYLRSGSYSLSNIPKRIRVPSHRTSFMARTRTIIIINILNNLPVEILPCDSEKFSKYLKRLKSWLLDVDAGRLMQSQYCV